MSTRRRSRSRLGLLTGVAAAVILALPGAALANTNPQIAATGGMTATLPLLGSSLTVAVTLDAVGNISDVSLDPIGTYSATGLDAHAVTFANTEGTAQVSVKAKGSRLSIKATVGSLADLLGSGTWSADVFGTGETTTVAYTIGDAGDGTPTISIDSVSAPSGVTATVIPTETETEDGDLEAKARVDFSSNGFEKRLTIKVSVETGDATADADSSGDDSADQPAATLKITLSGKDRQELVGTLAELFGPHTWSGTLCDGTAVDATFNVAADGALSFAGASGAPATAESHEGGVVVRFDGTNVTVKARLALQDDGLYRLEIRGTSGDCGSHDTAPTVNTPIAPSATCDEADHDSADETDHDGADDCDSVEEHDSGDTDGEHDGGGEHDGDQSDS